MSADFLLRPSNCLSSKVVFIDSKLVGLTVSKKVPSLLNLKVKMEMTFLQHNKGKCIQVQILYTIRGQYYPLVILHICIWEA
ncbi:hypothetical protein V6Z12_D13G001300 [Gossypium hirsutum]